MKFRYLHSRGVDRYVYKRCITAGSLGDLCPKGASRAQLHDEGQIANMVDVLSCWDKKTRKRIEDSFKLYPRYANTLI